MLKFFRDRVGGFLMKVILGLIILVFMFWGVDSYNSLQVNVLAEVNGEPIYLNDFLQRYDNNYQRILASGQKVSDEQSQALRKSTLESIINDKLLLNQIKDWGSVPTKERIAYRIITNPGFQTDGVFDKSKLENYVSSNRMTNQEFESRTSDIIAFGKFNSLLDTVVQPGEPFLKIQTDFLTRKVKYNYFTVKDSTLGPPPKISEADMKKYYEENKNSYFSEEPLEVKYFLLEGKDVLQNAKISERQISNYYQKNREKEFKEPAGFLSRHILIKPKNPSSKASQAKAKNRANKITKDLRKHPEEFKELAKQYSQDPGSAAREGNLGWTPFGSFVPAFEEQIRKMKPGEISDPVKTRFGYHVIALDDLREDSYRELSEVSDLIEDKIIRSRREKRIARILKDLKERPTEELSEQLAQKYGKTLETISKFTPDSAVPFEKAAAVYQEMKTNGGVGAYLLNPGKVLVFSVQSVGIPSQLSYEEVKQQVKSQLTAQRLQERRQALAEKLERKKGDYKTLKALVRQEIQKSANLSEGEFSLEDYFVPGAGLNNDLKNSIYRQTEDSIAVYPSEETILLVQKTGVTQETLPEETMQSIEQNMLQLKRQIILSQIILSVKKDANIEYNAQELQRAGIRI